MRVEKLMTTAVRTCTPDDSVAAAARIMWEEDCGCVPVVASEHGAGARDVLAMITDRDICMAGYTQGKPLESIPVGAAMSRHLCSCRASDSIDVALRILQANQIRRMPVLDAENRLAGVISLADIAREARREAGKTARAVTASAVAAALEAITEPRSTRHPVGATSSAA